MDLENKKALDLLVSVPEIEKKGVSKSEIEATIEEANSLVEGASK